VPADGVRWVRAPDRVKSRCGWVLPGCGIAKRPRPRLIHRRRFTVLCRSRAGIGPAPPACGGRFRDAGPVRGARRRRCRPHRLTLLAFACAFVVPRSPPPQSQRGEEPAQESAGVGFLRLRCFIGSPSDGSRLPSQQPRGGTCEAGRPRSTARPASEDPSLSPSGSVALPPLRPQHAESQDRAGRRPGTAPARLLDPAATYNTTLTALRSTDRSASACSCAADRAEFAPARPIAGGSGGRSQRSLP
jgi:hypothetical protein